MDIKGEKHRTKIKIDKKKWDEILLLVNSLALIPNQAKNTQDKIIRYSIEFTNEDSEVKKYHFFNEQVPNDLMRLFEIIRNI